MSEQDSRQAFVLQRPTTGDLDAWKTYWKAQGQSWRIEPEINMKRQEELAQCRTLVPDIYQGTYPFKEVKLSRADVEWLLATHEKGRGPINWNDESQRERQGLDLRGADLSEVNLKGLPLACMRGGLTGVDILNVDAWQRSKGTGVDYRPAYMAAVRMQKADLTEAQLQKAVLTAAQLQKAVFTEAQLQGAVLLGAQLQGAFSRKAQLQEAVLREAQLQKAVLAGAELQEANLTGAQLQGAVLLGAELQEANLTGAQLQEAVLLEAQLQKANLQRAQLQDSFLSRTQLQEANLSGADLSRTQLQEANLSRADLSKTHLESANLTATQLQGANMEFSHLEGADLEGANLEGVNLQNAMMDINTGLAEVKLDKKILVADVIWNSVPLTRINWEYVPRLGDEELARRQKWLNAFRRVHRLFKTLQPLFSTSADRNTLFQLKNTLFQLKNELLSQFEKERGEYIRFYSSAVRANRQLALALQEQGLVEEAERFEYHAQILQREIYRRQQKIAKYLFSLFLAWLTGYGYRLWRIIIAYILVNLFFATIYWRLQIQTPPPNSHSVNYWEALVTSLQVIHGRVFNPFGLALPDIRVFISSVEAVIGLILEATLIAMLTQRFFRH